FLYLCGCFFFFFQAEDGIRAFHVTGVQTCALPISRPSSASRFAANAFPAGPRCALPSRTRARLAIVGHRESCGGIKGRDLLLGKRAMSTARQIARQFDIAELDLHDAADFQAAALEKGTYGSPSMCSM